MKIALIDSVSDLYGSSKICNLVVDILRDAGHHVSAYVRIERREKGCRYGEVLRYPLLVMSDLRTDPYAFIKSCFKDCWYFLRKFRELVSGADLIYCNTLGTVLIGLIAKLAGKRVVLHIHESLKFSLIQKWLVSRFVCAAASSIFVVSNATASDWGLSGHPKVKVVHNGIEDFRSPDEVKRAGNCDRKFHFSYIGRLTKKKGIFAFIEALRLLDQECLKSGERYSVAIAGGGIPGQSLPFSKIDLNQFKNLEVSYLGEISDPNVLLLETCVVCVPSIYADPYPTVVLESLRAGCAVIASNVGGAKEALEGAMGSLCAPDDSIELKEAMVKEIATWKIRPPVNTNRELFLSKHTLEHFRLKIVGHVESVYRDA